MAQAQSNGADTKKLVEAWYKAQSAYEQAQAELETLRAEAQRYAKDIYEALGTTVFTVKAAGPAHPGYRAMHKPARKSKPKDPNKAKDIAEAWDVIPVPQFAPVNKF